MTWLLLLCRPEGPESSVLMKAITRGVTLKNGPNLSELKDSRLLSAGRMLLPPERLTPAKAKAASMPCMPWATSTPWALHLMLMLVTLARRGRFQNPMVTTLGALQWRAPPWSTEPESKRSMRNTTRQNLLMFPLCSRSTRAPRLRCISGSVTSTGLLRIRPCCRRDEAEEDRCRDSGMRRRLGLQCHRCPSLLAMTVSHCRAQSGLPRQLRPLLRHLPRPLRLCHRCLPGFRA
mmetsp:Transcript_27695/g.60559  ORF Transcript_27695/g.60559 Transcript_27695/m.60559 type:complete len:234 (-) Transcript_27695:400-1101(-)